MLEILNLVAGYEKENMILKGIDLSIEENEIVAIVGQNGSGKSTLAKSIMNMVPFIDAKILFDGCSISKKDTSEISKYGISYFMQGGRIFPNLTVDENIAFVSGNMRIEDKNENKKKIKNYFELFNNEKRTKMKASYLSGGEQHQLALAMVLVQNPRFLILDEPSAGLSPANVINLYTSLSRIKRDAVKSILIIEQNVTSAVEFSNRVLLLREGEIKKNELSENLNSSEKIDEFFFGN